MTIGTKHTIQHTKAKKSGGVKIRDEEYIDSTADLNAYQSKLCGAKNNITLFRGFRRATHHLPKVKRQRRPVNYTILKVGVLARLENGIGTGSSSRA